MNYIKNILSIAKEHGYTNKQLCELLGKNPSYITDWKNGKSKPKADELLILSKEFNVSLDYLLCKTDTPTNNIPDLSEKQNELLNKFDQLSTDQQKDVLQYVEFIISKREKLD